jgi:hypothetical protein
LVVRWRGGEREREVEAETTETEDRATVNERRSGRSEEASEK